MSDFALTARKKPYLCLFFACLLAMASFPSAAHGANPTISRVSPDAAVTCTAGSSLTFTIHGEDADGNLRGAEWYGNPASPSKVMVTVVHKTDAADMHKTIAFPDPGVYEITVSAFDLDYGYSSTIAWTVHVSPPDHENPVTYRSLYVDSFNDILGDSDSELELLTFLQANSFSEIAVYGLHPILTKDSGYATRVANLRRFITTARASWGITTVKGIGMLNADFDDIAEYNTGSGANERFDGLVSEYEYWNLSGASIDTFAALLTHMRSVADAQSMTVDAYMGWLGSSGDKLAEATRIAALTDVVYLHAYRADPYKTYAYIQERLDLFSQAKDGIAIRPIFSAEWRPLSICSGPHTVGVGNMCFMGKWYETHSLRTAENLFMDFYYAERSGLGGNVAINGYQYFAYSHLKAAIGSGSHRWLSPLHYLLLHG